MQVHIENSPIFKDYRTGQLLDPGLVHAARAKELEYFKGKKVWELRPIDECRRVTGKPPVTVRWVDVSQNDDINPNARSRLATRQIRQAAEEAIFAWTSGPCPRSSIREADISLGHRHLSGVFQFGDG